MLHDVLSLEMSYDDADGEGLLPLARQLLAWAQDPHPDDERSQSALLAMAGDYFGEAGDVATAERLLRTAIDLHDGSGVDPRCYLVQLYLETGRSEDATDVDGQLRRARPEDLVVYSLMGQAWAPLDARRALGWFNRGLDLAERTGQDEVATYGLLCVGRFHVRQEQGQDLDRYDEIALQVLAEIGEDQPTG